MGRSNRETRRGVQVGSGRETDLRRQPARREQRIAVLVDTNGKSTERKYFGALKDLPWVHVGRVVVVFTNGSPVDVIRDAARRRSENDFDHAWAVCDIDSYNVGEAEIEAQRKGVGIAWSNPCFEVWLILHKASHNAFLENADKACERLSKILGREWDKSVLDFSEFEPGIADAVARAKLLDAPPANPSTGIWLVLESLGFGRKQAR
ncbi:RloB family protein [Micromonospora matsumotoense]|uniref:RloB family protein n=1 Tax=Micromonospora matsumotoense TaxID=121616 RepID=UPI000B830025